MSAYLILKHLHVTTACVTIALFSVRLLLDAAGKPDWRDTPLRWLPHTNDTVLLGAAIGLLFVTPWMPLVHDWLTLKVLLLIGYIFTGYVALKPKYGTPARLAATLLALAQIAAIVLLALQKPLLWS